MRRILVIEPDECIRDTLVTVLRMEGLAVATRESPEDAVEYLKTINHVLDVILTDLNLDRMSAVDFIKALRSMDPRVKDVPVVIMGTCTTVKPPEETIVVKKPFDIQELLNAIDMAVKAREAEILLAAEKKTG